MHHQMKELFEEKLAKCSGRLSDRKAIADLILKNKALYHYTLEKINTPHSPNIQRLCWSLDCFLGVSTVFQGSISVYCQRTLCTKKRQLLEIPDENLCCYVTRPLLFYSDKKSSPKK